MHPVVTASINKSINKNNLQAGQKYYGLNSMSSQNWENKCSSYALEPTTPQGA
jgi:hypothetical protein